MSSKPFSETFSVDSALLQELGERLVTTPHVALAELVKNSYDADATEVRVTIRESKSGGPEIEVKDNGRGMTTAEIRQYWMRIGNTHKASEARSPRFGRPLSGSKGIGRFCVRRLGTSVNIESIARVNGHFEKNDLQIDWKKFVAGVDVGKVPVTGKTESVHAVSPGLKLTMSGHHVIEWRSLEDKRSYHYLLRQLASLTANGGAKRRGYEVDPGFKVLLDAPSLEFGHNEAAVMNDGNGQMVIDMREKLMNAGWALLTAHVDKDGKVQCELEADSPIGKQSHTSGFKLEHLKHVSLKLAVFVEEAGWNRDETLVPLGKLNEILKQWGGVQVRQNGMRVFPYGEATDDWLEIEKDRARRLGKAPEDFLELVATLKARAPKLSPATALLNMLSEKAFLGSVNIGERQKGLQQKADREGFIDNEVFQELKLFSRHAVNCAMIWRDYVVKMRERGKAARFRQALERIQGGKAIGQSEQGEVAMRTLRHGIEQMRKDPSSITAQEVTTMATAANLLEADFKVTRGDLHRFQLVASAATLSLLYHHEVRYLSSTLDALSAELQDAVKVLKGALKTRCEEVLGTLASSKDSLEALGDLTQDMGILDRKAQAISLDLSSNVERAVARFQRVCESYRIDLTQRVDEGLLVGPMLKGELAAVLLNVLSNAIKAVIAGGKSKALIDIHGYRHGKKVMLDVSDNGIGLENDEKESVFTPLVSDPSAKLYDALEERLDASERQLLGQGSGLGLAIVRGVLENRNGSAKFREASSGWSTCLHLEFATPS